MVSGAHSIDIQYILIGECYIRNVVNVHVCLKYTDVYLTSFFQALSKVLADYAHLQHKKGPNQKRKEPYTQVSI